MNEQLNEKNNAVRNVRLNQYRWQSNFTVRILLFVRRIMLHPGLSIHILSGLFTSLSLSMAFFFSAFYGARKILCLILYINYTYEK